MSRVAFLSMALWCALALFGCDRLSEIPGLVTAEDVAGTHTGALEGITVATKEDLKHKEARVIVDVDVLHDVLVEKTGELEARISSQVIPPIRVAILGAGPIAMDLKVIDVELSSSPDDQHLKSVAVDQLVFVKHEGAWVLVLQMSKLGLATDPGSTVNAYQYVSYPPSVAGQLSRDEAIQYVDTVLDIASEAQRL